MSINPCWQTFIKQGSKALSVAAERGHLEILKFLIENGADIEKAAKFVWWSQR
mgnify:CR=1 FL=1